MTLAVYKLGGSLLSLPDLAARLKRLFERETSHPRRLLVSGGGGAADIVRDWDRLHGLGEERAHWLALESLRLNESLLAELLPGGRVVRSRDEAECVWDAGGLPILCACDFLREEERRAALPLPHTWDVTSDSIAAWVAAVWPADRLVLLKSVALATRGTGSAPDAAPPVDAYFHVIAPRVRDIRWANLREDALTVEEWPRDGAWADRV